MAMMPISIAYGDGIGPEIMAAVLGILGAAGAAIESQTVEIGKKIYRRGNPAGIEPDAWESLRRTRVFLKAPITTPEGGAYKSFNVAARPTLGLYANVRPCVSYHPFIETLHPQMDVVIIRESECRFLVGQGGAGHRQVLDLLEHIAGAGLEIVKTESLRKFDGRPGFSPA